MYVYPSICLFTLLKERGVRAAPREGGRPDSPLRSVLNKLHNYVYPDVCTFTRLYVRLPEYIHVYPDVYAFT